MTSGVSGSRSLRSVSKPPCVCPRRSLSPCRLRPPVPFSYCKSCRFTKGNLPVLCGPPNFPRVRVRTWKEYGGNGRSSSGVWFVTYNLVCTVRGSPWHRTGSRKGLVYDSPGPLPPTSWGRGLRWSQVWPHFSPTNPGRQSMGETLNVLPCNLWDGPLRFSFCTSGSLSSSV